MRSAPRAANQLCTAFARAGAIRTTCTNRLSIDSMFSLVCRVRETVNIDRMTLHERSGRHPLLCNTLAAHSAGALGCAV